MIWGLKRICDICFYMTFASFIGLAFFGGTSLLITLPIFAVVAFLIGALSRHRVLRCIPIVLLGGCFFVVPLYIANIVILIPAILYMVFALSNNEIDHYECARVFKIFLRIYLAFITVMLLMGLGIQQLREQLEISVLPFGIAYMFGSVVLLRMLRHDDRVHKDARFKALNILSVVGVVVAVLIISSGTFLGVITRSVSFFYIEILVPVLIFIITWVTTIIMFILGPLLNLLSTAAPEYATVEMDGVFEMADSELTAMREPGIARIILTYLLYAVLIALAVFLLYRLAKKLRTKVSRAVPFGKVPTQLRTSLPDSKEPKRRIDSDNQIRAVYRKFLAHCRGRGIGIQPYMTSQDVENHAAKEFGRTESRELRELYIKVRYGGAKFSADEIKRAKALHSEIKSHSTTDLK